MTASTQPEPLEARQTGVQVDFRDPNHPHFPGDLESQPISRPFLSKKARWIAGASILPVIALVTAMIVGGKFGMNSVQKPVPSPVTSTISEEPKTVYMTTIEISTSVFTQSATPDVTTITTTMTPTLSFQPPVPALTLDDGTDRQAQKCITYGSFDTWDDCVAKCNDEALARVVGGKSQCRNRNSIVDCLICR